MQRVYIVGTAQIPVRKQHGASLRLMGAQVVRGALADAGLEQADALYLGNMLSDELQAQKHLAALVADEAGLYGIEALQVRAATATGAAALRLAYLAVASGTVDTAVAVGVEKMSSGPATPALAKALDAELEVPGGATLISQNAKLMSMYMEHYRLPTDAFVNFAVNAHRNANQNANALFREKVVTAGMVAASRIIVDPIRLFDCAPVCDGAAAVVLAARPALRGSTEGAVRLLASAVSTDRFRIADRSSPLQLAAAVKSAAHAFQQAGITKEDVDFFEVHDAFSIMSCLQLEAVGFAPAGQGWRLALEEQIMPDGRIPIATMGGLKARGHPIGATAIYQTCEIVQQLRGRAGANQLPAPRVGMLQSIGGAGSTILTHVFGTG